MRKSSFHVEWLFLVPFSFSAASYKFLLLGPGMFRPVISCGGIGAGDFEFVANLFVALFHYSVKVDYEKELR